MIVFRHNGEIVRIGRWEDMVDRPAFTYDLGSTDIKLKDVIGKYKLPTPYYCGLADCHRPHNKGYLILTEDDQETNVGHVCGSHHFGLVFDDMARILERDLEAFDNRERLTTLKNQSQSFREEIRKIQKTYDLHKLSDRLKHLKSRRNRFPDKIADVIWSMIKRRDGKILVEVQTSKRDRELESISSSNYASATGKKGSRPNSSFTTKTLGNLKGIEAFYPTNDFIRILDKELLPQLVELDAFELEKSSEKEIRDMVKRFDRFDKRIYHVEESIGHARTLLQTENLMQLYPLIEGESGCDVFEEFCKHSVGSHVFYKVA